jgi:predicted RNA binding protein YcfA (HicA-like mRNA interferase family)
VSRLTPVHWKDLEKVVLKAGLRFVRQKGSHRVYTKSGITRPIVIPERSEVPVSIIKNLIDVLGISREEYLALLKE